MTRPGGPWQNWARSASVRPERYERPRSPEAVQRAVQAAAAQHMAVKAVGSGHSFSGIAVAPGVLLDLTDLSGLVRVDAARARATFLAGTRLHHVPKLLAGHGLAMTNLGDIDRQSISGAISTGTHGTGLGFGGLATQVVGVTVVTAAGEFMRIDEDEHPELLPAFALGLGALGIIVEVTVQCVPSFVLRAVEAAEPIDAVVGTMLERAASQDHFEFYWFPHTDLALTKTNTRLPEHTRREPLSGAGKWIDEVLLANGVFGLACGAGAIVPAAVPTISRTITKLTGNRTYTDVSPRVFTQQRSVRFREMEYALPVEAVAAAFDEVRACIARRGWRISFPLEVRFAAADDRWLSTASGRTSAYIAVHRYWRENPETYFRAVEEILLAHGGRPHWGKMHSLTADMLRERYPRMDDFLQLRERMDPDRMFANRHLSRILGT